MDFFNLERILYNLRQITKYLLSAFVIVAFIVVCLLIMEKSSFCAEYESNYGRYYVDDYMISQVEQNTEYFSDDYMYAIWSYSYNSMNYYVWISTPKDNASYILDYNTSTRKITYNPALITDNFSTTGRICDFSTNLLTNKNFATNGWFSQDTVRTVYYSTINGDTFHYLWGSPGAIRINGNAYSDFVYPTNTDYWHSMYYDNRSLDKGSFASCFNVSDNGIVRYQGITAYRIYEDNYMKTSYTYQNVDFTDSQYNYIPFVYRSSKYDIQYNYIKVPVNSSYYAYNGATTQDDINTYTYQLKFTCDKPFEVYNDTSGLLASISANGVYTSCPNNNNECTTFGLCENYSDANKSNLLYEYIPQDNYRSPSLLNYDDQVHANNQLVTGENLTYFFIDAYTDTPLYVYFYDMNAFNSEDESSFNGWSANMYEKQLVNGVETYTYFYTPSAEGVYSFAIPVVLPFGSYKNNTNYKMVLQYKNKYDTWETKTYEWTTNFTQAGITKQDENANDNMLKNANNLNNYINDTIINSSIILNGMPSNVYQQSPVQSGFTNIYNLIRNAFLDLSYREISFPIPHSEEEITIPSDLITSHIPSAWLLLIRSFYWFFICRHIVKTIAWYFKQLASGDLTTSANFQAEDIRTAML